MKWLHCPRHPEYEVSEYGHLRRKGKVRKPYLQADGYLVYCLMGHKTRKVHQLVLEAFVGPKPEGGVCRHLDGNRTNNHITNLRWGTRSENSKDRWDHGRGPLRAGTRWAA
jgi:hypothetical protein